jgi:hypothetical protein
MNCLNVTSLVPATFIRATSVPDLCGSWIKWIVAACNPCVANTSARPPGSNSVRSGCGEVRSRSMISTSSFDKSSRSGFPQNNDGSTWILISPGVLTRASRSYSTRRGSPSEPVVVLLRGPRPVRTLPPALRLLSARRSSRPSVEFGSNQLRIGDRSRPSSRVHPSAALRAQTAQLTQVLVL